MPLKELKIQITRKRKRTRTVTARPFQQTSEGRDLIRFLAKEHPVKLAMSIPAKENHERKKPMRLRVNYSLWINQPLIRAAPPTKKTLVVRT